MSVFDSEIFQVWFVTPEMRRVFSDQNTIQQWLNVEAALAAAEAEVGLLPPRIAKAIAARAHAEFISSKALRKCYREIGYPILPLLKVWNGQLGNQLSHWVHWGATTQDITDTGMVLQCRQAVQLLEIDLNKLVNLLKATCRRYRGSLMAGRTHGQHAVPITFGFKVAVWVSELRRHIDRLGQLKPRLMVGQLGGASGTLASLGRKGTAVQKAMMKRLGLGLLPIAWHTARDNFSELASWLAMVGCTLERIAHEVELLQKTEVGELAESHRRGKGASSTMPQKRNPVTCEAIISLGRLLREQVPAVMASMTQEHERDWWAIHLEWKELSEMFMLCSASFRLSIKLIRTLKVSENRMLENLERTQGLIMAEALMMRLSEKIGRAAAHETIYELSMQAAEENLPLVDVVRDNSQTSRFFSRQEIEALLNPQNYLGQALSAINRVLGKH